MVSVLFRDPLLWAFSLQGATIPTCMNLDQETDLLTSLPASILCQTSLSLPPMAGQKTTIHLHEKALDSAFVFVLHWPEN